ncbi:hypothetical protein CLNEO_05250 [Anaerotignum neopropionicum]|uniref:Siphovirus Gp157 n=1 Tax=Anaerotignum neopropionicum TaxID=36847 RepID=A0A136WJ89_9FIRM|nr:siphovirus Gp157 family protein [Anaerotignum neopropionicum]KXL54419.1 hypothetical protein CLNEO_05250 [Anaerotignum neopropionicum]
MSTLYELTENYTQLQDMLLSEEYDEQAIADTMEITEFEIEEKAENYAKIMKNIDGDIVAIEEEIKRLTERKKRYEARKKVLSDNLFTAMKITGNTKFKTPMFSFSIAKNGGKQSIDVFGDVPEDYKKIVAETDNEKIRKALEGGETLKFAILKERGEHLSIR